MASRLVSIRRVAGAAIAWSVIATPPAPGSGSTSLAFNGTDTSRAATASARFDAGWSVVAERRYRLDVRVRPLLFWMARDDVGDGFITWRRDPSGGLSTELLIGSDPLRAPLRVNRWGYVRETIRGSEAEVLGMMSEADEETVNDARAHLGKQAGARTFNAVSARVGDGRATATVSVLMLKDGVTLRNIDTALAALPSAAPVRTSSLTVPRSTAPGLLTALSTMLEQQTREWGRAPTKALPLPPAGSYFHAGRLYTLRLRRSRLTPEYQLHGRSYGPVIEGEFETENMATNHRTRFDLAFRVAGDDSGRPIRIRFRPRWWFEAELVLREESR